MTFTCSCVETQIGSSGAGVGELGSLTSVRERLKNDSIEAVEGLRFDMLEFLYRMISFFHINIVKNQVDMTCIVFSSTMLLTYNLIIGKQKDN